MTQLLNLELAIHNQNSMQKGDWTPLVLVSTQQTKKPKPTTEDIDAFTLSILEKYVTETLLEYVVQTVCEGSFEKKRLGAFMNAVVTSLEENAELQNELEQNNIKMKAIGKKINEKARLYPSVLQMSTYLG
jgi:hypothetical protein